TNWSLGLFASYFGNNRARFILINVCAFLTVVLLALVQKRLMPSSALFFSPKQVYRELYFAHLPSLFSLKEVASMFGLAHYDFTMVEAIKRITNFWLFTGVTPPTTLASSSQIALYVTNSNGPLVSSYAAAVVLTSWIIMLGSGIFSI